jgi:hypothetical protein
LFSDLVDDQTTIDSFVVHSTGILVVKRYQQDTHGRLYMFTHDGHSIVNDQYNQHCSLRQVIMDINMNALWSIDEQQRSIFVSSLSDETQLFTRRHVDYFHHRSLYKQMVEPFVPNILSVGNDHLAILDKHRQTIHIYDKRNRDKLYEYVNSHSKTTHVCWNMALFADQSLLIRLDEINTLKTGPTKHVYIHVDAARQNDAIGIIEEIDAYGMTITSTNEILLGVRMNNRGIVKCYT